MEISILIAQILSIIYLAFAVGLLVSSEFYKNALELVWILITCSLTEVSV